MMQCIICIYNAKLLTYVTAQLTSCALESPTLPMIDESEGLITSRYSFDDGGTISPLI